MADSEAVDLAKSLRKAFVLLVGAQTRALVSERQAAPAADADDDLLAEAAEAQVAMRDQASELLSTIIPNAMGAALTPIDRLLNLGKTIEAAIAREAASGGPEAAAKLTGYIDALADAADQLGRSTGGLHDDLSGWNGDLKRASDALDAAAKAVAGAIKGKDGRIIALNGQIAAKRQQIDAAIDGILTGARAVGDQAENLVTGALTYLDSSKAAGGGKKPGKPDASDFLPVLASLAKKDDEIEEAEEEDAEAEAAAAKRKEAAKKAGKEAVQAIKATEKSARDIGGACATLNRCNQELAELYLELAHVRLELAWARAIADQGRSLERSGAAAVGAFVGLSAQWAELATRLRGIAGGVRAAGSAKALPGEWRAIQTSALEPLRQALPAIHSAFTGKARLIAL